MIVVTGGAGFIGSNLVNFLESQNTQEIVSVDWDNYENAHYFKNKNLKKVSPENLELFLNKHNKSINLIIHLGAVTSTTETDAKLIINNNINLSLFIWSWCVENKKRLIYASSAATYGDGMNGFSDRHDLITNLKPLNEYGQRKQDFDEWALSQNNAPNFWAGLKYFNVYGPGEAHKGRMASVVCHFLDQLKTSSEIKLFDSSHGVGPGEQKRDFVYIDDAIDMTLFMMIMKFKSGI